MASAFWLRVLIMLRLTKLFGPLIRIILVMLKELGIFLILWVITVLVFAGAGFVLFGEEEKYNTLFKAIIINFEHALGVIEPH